MGGVDKGLQHLGEHTLVEHALARLRPQVGPLAINANRHAGDYAALGLPVWPDAIGGFHGPLAGMLAGLASIDTDWLVTVPCDTPSFPADLVARLGDAATQAGCRIAMPVTRDTAGEAQPQPLFCLLHRSLRAALEEALAGGERKIELFTRGQGQVLVPFDDAAAFFNANTPGDLEHLRSTRAS